MTIFVSQCVYATISFTNIISVAYTDKVGLVEPILAKYPPPPVTKQQKGAVHGNLPWEEAEVMCKESSVPERRPLRTASPKEN